MDNAIAHFFDERKAAWLKTRLKSSLSEEKQQQLQEEAKAKFDLANWLPDAAKRVSQLKMSSHPGKFSHPYVKKTTPVIAHNQSAKDGYLRSGNVEKVLDVYGDAAALDVYKFLELSMNDGMTVLTHLEQNSQAIQALMHIPTAKYDDLRQSFLSIKYSGGVIKTSTLLKQVYFPVDGAYHLLSLLTSSGLLSQLKCQIDERRFSEKAKQARECRKKNEYHKEGFGDIYGLTVIGFGGSQPRNISALNNQNAGRFYLLNSCPPIFQRRQLRLPARDFFKQSLNPLAFKEAFDALDALIRNEYDNRHIKDGRQNCIKFIIDNVLQRVFLIRATGAGWSEADYYQSLPEVQRIWLDDAYQTRRDEEEEWMKEIAAACSRWIIKTYEKLCTKGKPALSDHNFSDIKRLVKQAVSEDQEFFR